MYGAYKYVTSTVINLCELKLRFSFKCYHIPGLEIATDTVANATNIFSLATKNSGLVAKVATRFLYILDLN